MPDVTDEEIRKEIEKILKNADLLKVSTKKVIQKLEETFDCELRDRKRAIDQMLLDYVNSMESEEDKDDDDEEEEEEPPKKKPPKRTAAATKRSKKRKATSDESDEDDSNDSEYEEKKPKPKKAAAKGKKGGGKGGGYTRAYKLSPALADLMGAEEMPRHEVVKRMWAIIKEKQLYDPNNKQFAICDDPLYKVIGTKRFRIFGMMKYLKTHFLDE